MPRVLRISTIAICFISFVAISSNAHSESNLTEKRFVDALRSVSNQKGVQVGIIVDPHTSKSESPYLEVITVDNESSTAFEVLEKAKIKKRYHPQFNTPPMVMVVSLDGYANDKNKDGQARNWAFFTADKDSEKWSLATEGVATEKVRDGMLLGFSLTEWKGKEGKYLPKKEPKFLRVTP